MVRRGSPEDGRGSVEMAELLHHGSDGGGAEAGIGSVASKGRDYSKPLSARLAGFSRQFFRETIPAWLTVAVMLGLIFGGCCSNVSRQAII